MGLSFQKESLMKARDADHINYFIYLAITELKKKKIYTEGTLSYNSYAKVHLRCKDKF